MKISQESPKALQNPWVLGMLLFLLVFLSANAIFIYLAFESAPSLVVDDFYERGEAYEESQQRLEAEKALGWSGVLMMPPQARVNQTQRYEAIITGKNSAALTLDSVMFYAYRPSDAKADFEVMMTSSGLSSYEAEVSFNLPGRWDLIIEAKQGDNRYSLTRTIRIEP